MSFEPEILQNFCQPGFIITQMVLLDFQTYALRMTVELRGVHTLHIGHTGLIFSTVLNPD